MTKKIDILFLCTGNSCRSQMAEGWTRHLKGDVINAASAGVETHGLNPCAVEAMRLAGVDISHHKSKHIDEFKGQSFDYVITVCDHAKETCPWFPGGSKVIHIGFEDPPLLAKAFDTEKEKLGCYIKVRDDIKQFIKTLPESLQK